MRSARAGLTLRALERAAGCGRPAAEERTRGRSGQQERAGEEAEDADDRDSGAAEGEAERVAEPRAEVAAIALRASAAGRARRRTVPCGTGGRRRGRCGRPSGRRRRRARAAARRPTPPTTASSAIADPAADVAAVPAGPEHGGRGRARTRRARARSVPDAGAPGASSSSRASLPHARGRARLEHAFRASPRHVRAIRRAGQKPFAAPNRTCLGTRSRDVA